jgi:sigma-B regulation protein RsbU (phosphoserine phosphatase)
MPARTTRHQQRDGLYHVAHTLQRSLLPEALPVLDGLELASVYRPADHDSEAGGDFYDVFHMPGSCWLVIGDVCGKGVEAAAVTAMVRHSIRALAFREISPAQVLGTVNEVMLSHDLSGRFATAMVVRIDCSTRTGLPTRAILTSAGHPPPVLVDPAGQASSSQIQGTLLGVLPQPRLYDVEMVLNPGSTLVLYTDGLTDAGAPARALPAQELCRELAGHAGCSPRMLAGLLEDLAVSRGAGRLRDDVAILTARVNG